MKYNGNESNLSAQKLYWPIDVSRFNLQRNREIVFEFDVQKEDKKISFEDGSENLILCGNERLRLDVHKGLIEATLKFIQATKRFLFLLQPSNTWAHSPL